MTSSETKPIAGTTSPLRILILSDDLPGHVNQSRGLIRWLSTRRPTVATEYIVKLRSRALARWLMRFQLHSTSPRRVFERFHRATTLDQVERPDVIVSAGGNTSFANVLLSRYFDVPNVFLGSRRRIPADRFSAHITLEPAGAASNIVVQVAPSVVDPTELPGRAAIFRDERKLDTERCWALAIGGDGAGIAYGPEDWRRLGEWMNRTAVDHGIRWLVSTSRRTGGEAETILEATLRPETIAYAVWWNRNPERVLLGMFGCATRLFVTTDSMSMISECIGTERPVTLIRCGNGQHAARYQAALDRYVESGLCAVTHLDAVPDIGAHATHRIAAIHEDQLDQLIERIHG